MMITSLLPNKIIVIDCQTTGISSKTSELLQIAWCIYDHEKVENSAIKKYTLKLEDNISEKILKMLNLSQDEVNTGVESDVVFSDFQQDINDLGDNPVVVAHYSQFEKMFLKKLYIKHLNIDKLNFELICTQKIAKSIYPSLPSYNLKALAGYFKLSNAFKNNVVSHVEMTLKIYKKILSELYLNQLKSMNDISSSFKNLKPMKPAYKYNISQIDRLSISTKPGIYRFLDNEKNILYIGKAKSLRSRINSYFRGVKNRDRRKLEMLAQAWFIEVHECDCDLEALLLESEEIKHFLPPYNILLKPKDNKYVYFNADFNFSSNIKSSAFSKGPFREGDSLINLWMLFKAYKARENITCFGEIIDIERLKVAWNDFEILSGYKSDSLLQLNFRSILAISVGHMRQFESKYSKGVFEKWWKEEKKLTSFTEAIANDLGHRIYRLSIRSAELIRRNVIFNMLFNSKIRIKSTSHSIMISKGKIKFNKGRHHMVEKTHITHSIDEPYASFSILLSAKQKKLITIKYL